MGIKEKIDLVDKYVSRKFTKECIIKKILEDDGYYQIYRWVKIMDIKRYKVEAFAKELFELFIWNERKYYKKKITNQQPIHIDKSGTIYVDLCYNFDEKYRAKIYLPQWEYQGFLERGEVTQDIQAALDLFPKWYFVTFIEVVEGFETGFLIQATVEKYIDYVNDN